MGLDNIPYEYPCKKNGLAVLDDDGRINCQRTIEDGRCPYHVEKQKDPLVSKITAVYGMLGTDCWYRGKYGNMLLEEMTRFNPEFEIDSNFYGDIEETENSQGGISASMCLSMSEQMTSFAESWADYVRNYSEVAGNNEEEQSLIEDWIYAAWWLRFVGRNCNGSAVWY